MYGKKLLEYHFVVGYRKDGGEYYFIDLLTENGCVYLANRTKGWAYSPDNLSNNDLKIYSSIDEYIKERLFWARRIEESSRNDRPEYTEEEKQKMIADFFADMNKQFPRKK
ncbi:hypothetical protein SDC9_138379 [bioreactor metagenome]|uniref:Uncharacterized protein n=1 Tax=bioreactor metagenome TaxID=1076179 RepID=A0A645DS18_9ZZZZ